MTVFLLAPNFLTLGGFEVQFSALAAALVEQGVRVHVFVREPVRPDHPYWQRMARAGVRLTAPPAWLARLLAPSAAARAAFLRALIVLCWPLLLPAVKADALLRRRPLRRSWQGGLGRLHGWLARWVYFDGLTWWMESRMDRALPGERPAVIDVHHSMLPSGIAYGKRRGLPTVYTEHGAPSKELWSVWAGLCPQINHADFILARSEASLVGLRGLCGAARPSAVVPQSVADVPDSDADAELPPFADGEVVIAAVGRLAPEKGPQYLLEAFRLLIEAGLPVRLVLAGDGPLRESLQARAIAWGIADRAAFTGVYPAVGPILKAAHIVAHPTLNDGRSVSVLEAMAWGRPVVASRTGGLPELIEDQVCGLLVPPADSAALAQALKELALDPERCRRLGRAARVKFLAGGYSAEHTAVATLAIYERVAQQKLAPAISGSASLGRP